MGTSDYKRIGKSSLEGKWGVAIGAYFVALLLGGTLAESSSNVSIDLGDLSTIVEGTGFDPQFRTVILTVTALVASFGLAFSMARLFIGSIVCVGYSQFNIDVIDGKEVKFGRLFSWFNKDQWGKAVCTNLFRILFTFLWMLLFIIPGIIAAYGYSMTGFILAENPDLSPREAIRRSKELMDGHKFELFCLWLSFIGWDILTVLTLGVLSIWVGPWKQAATAAFYRDLAPLHVPSDEESVEGDTEIAF